MITYSGADSGIVNIHSMKWNFKVLACSKTLIWRFHTFPSISNKVRNNVAFYENDPQSVGIYFLFTSMYTCIISIKYLLR